MYHQFNYIAYLFLCATSCWTMRGYPEGTTKSHLLGGLVFIVRCHSVEQCDLLTPIATVYIFFFCFMPEHSDLDLMNIVSTFRFQFNENCRNIQIQWKLAEHSDLDSMKTVWRQSVGRCDQLTPHHFLAARSLLISLYIAIQANFQAGRIIIMTTIMLMIPIMSINCISLILTTTLF